MARILIVEDEPDTRDYLKALLEDNNFEVCMAIDGEEGIAKLDECKPDLVILDMIMPKASGVKLYRHMKFNDAYKQIPVVVSTGIGKYRDLFDRDRDALPNPEAFFEKPIDEKEFVASITKLTS